MKKVLFGNEAREKLVKGVNVLAEAVGSTLGPKGSNVAMTEGMGYPHVVHDGVTVARSIDLEDPFEDMGAQLVKGAAQRTNDVAGDGTTTSTILAQSIVNQGMAAIKKGANPMVLKAEIDEAVEQVITNLKTMAIPVTKEDYKKKCDKYFLRTKKRYFYHYDYTYWVYKRYSIYLLKCKYPTLTDYEINEIYEREILSDSLRLTSSSLDSKMRLTGRYNKIDEVALIRNIEKHLKE